MIVFLLVIALIAGIVALARSRLEDAAGWGVTLLAVALLWARYGT